MPTPGGAAARVLESARGKPGAARPRSAALGDACLATAGLFADHRESSPAGAEPPVSAR